MLALVALVVVARELVVQVEPVPDMFTLDLLEFENEVESVLVAPHSTVVTAGAGIVHVIIPTGNKYQRGFRRERLADLR